MDELSTNDLAQAFVAMAEAINAKKDWLCELDGHIGDADHGVTMSVGFNAVRDSVAVLDAGMDPTALFNQAAKELLSAMGGSAGPLYATAFMRAGASVKGKEKLDAGAMGAVIIAMTNGIKMRGQAAAGDKTMLDAWLPASEAASKALADGARLAPMLDAVASAARAGAEATIPLLAIKGRAARLEDRSVGHMDPGAASTMVILEALAKHVAG